MSKEKKILLEAADYWKWRTAICEMDIAKSKHETETANWMSILKDIEISRLKERIAQIKNLPEANAEVENSKKEYTSLTKELEEKYSISLANKVIHDATFEVKPLDKQNKSVTI